LLVCEDAAQALGSRFAGRHAGTFGAFGTFSFYPAKLLGCFGDGGAIATNDDSIAVQIKLLRDHGRNDEGKVVAWGLNSRLDNLQAAVLLHKFKTYPADIARRRAIAQLYHDHLKDVHQLSMPPAPQAGTGTSGDAAHFDVYQNFELQAERRDALKAHLLEVGVRTIIQWAGTPVHAFKELGFTQQLPRTERFFERCLMLPMNTALQDDDVLYIANCIKQFYR
jgi:dTDP-4-amino-4,6-dideoxygalactose transaminase